MDVQRLGWCTILNMGETPNICPICHQARKALHQPFQYLFNFYVCAFCFDEVKQQGEAFYKTPN
jgi:hypothetical protein